jgi:phosphoribosyl 1,2-cyclic phosphate phosphodiesterase
MKIKFLGTGGSEGIPALFCRCAVCESARKNKGKEIRSRASALIDGRLMIDFSPDTYYHATHMDVDLTAVSALFITHSHSDHFYPEDILMRTYYASFNRTEEILNVYGGAAVMEGFSRVGYERMSLVQKNTLLHTVKPMETVEAAGITVTPFETVHMLQEKCFIYLLQKDGKNYLHITDSDIPKEETFAYLKDNKIRLDAVTMDCTYGIFENNFGGHMDIRKNKILMQRLKEIGATDEHTKFFATHISHVGGDFDKMQEVAAENGIILAYDGMEVEI